MLKATGHVLHPKLRPLDIRPHTQSGQAYILLRDPTQISEHTLLIPRPLATALAFCDGMHDAHAIRMAFEEHHNMALPSDLLEQLLSALDEAFMLENTRADQARARTVEAYRLAPFRPPALAGQAYPAEPHRLRLLLDNYLADVTDEQPTCCVMPLVYSARTSIMRGADLFMRKSGSKRLN